MSGLYLFNSASNISRGFNQISEQLNDSNTHSHIGRRHDAYHQTIDDIARSSTFEQFKVQLIWVCCRDLNGAEGSAALWTIINRAVDRGDQIIPNIDHKFLVLQLSREYQLHTYNGPVSTRYFLMERLEDRIVWSWLEGKGSFTGVLGLVNGIVPNLDVSLRTVARAFLAYNHCFPDYSALCFNCWYFSAGMLYLLLDGITPTAFCERLELTHRKAWKRKNGGQGLSPIERIFFDCFFACSYDLDDNLVKNVDQLYWSPRVEVTHEWRLSSFERCFGKLSYHFNVWGHG